MLVASDRNCRCILPARSAARSGVRVIPTRVVGRIMRVSVHSPHLTTPPSGGEACRRRSMAGQSGTTNHAVTATNPIDGTILTAQHAVTVASTHKRVLYSDPPKV